MPSPSSSLMSEIAKQALQRILPPGVSPDPYRTFIADMSGAIAGGFSQWHASATLTGVVINAVTANGGRLIGPPLAPLVLAQAPRDKQWMAYSKAIADGFGSQFQLFESGVTVPGLPWYPAFAAFPGPAAPPTRSPLPWPWGSKRRCRSGSCRPWSPTSWAKGRFPRSLPPMFRSGPSSAGLGCSCPAG